MAGRHWLLKTEPGVFSFEDLAKCPDQTTGWEGVRNYQARNLLRDEIKRGDGLLIYHSNADPPAVVGLAKVARAAYPDPFQFDPKSRYYDPKARPESPPWLTLDVRYDRPLVRAVPLAELRETPALAGMALVRKGNRLSVQPVSAEEWKVILALGGRSLR